MKWFVVVMTLFISACQVTLPSADFDLNRDYSRYSTWQWHTQAFRYDDMSSEPLLEQRLKQAIDNVMIQRGLTRQAPAQLWLQVTLSQKTYQDQYTTQLGGYWGGMGLYQTRTVEYPVHVITLDLFDSQEQRLVWRNRVEFLQDDHAHPSLRERRVYQRVQTLLSQFPPR